MSLTLVLLPDRLAVCQVPADAPVPQPPAEDGVWSVTRTADELSLVWPEAAVEPGWRVEREWRCLQVVGPLPFELIGILADLATALAHRDVSVFALSTYETDYLLVKVGDVARACDALEEAGYQVLG